MTDEPGANVRPSGRRRVVAVAVLGLAVAAGATSYLLVDRATARAADAGRLDGIDEVQETLRLGKPTVVEFGANACATCRDMKPVGRISGGEILARLRVDLAERRP